MYSIFDFLNRLYNKPTYTPIFFDDLIREDYKEIETRDTPIRRPTPLQTPSIKDIFVKKIRALVVLHKGKIMKLAEGIIPAPIGVEIDSKTGQLMVPVEVVPIGEVVLSPRIVDELLINEGFIKLKIIAYSSDTESCSDARKCLSKEATIPIHSVHQIDGICPSDNVQEKVEIKSISVIGTPDNSTAKSAGQKINLTIKAVLEVKLVISREEIISVLACKQLDNS